jgi:hypothetical protein
MYMISKASEKDFDSVSRRGSSVTSSRSTTTSDMYLNLSSSASSYNKKNKGTNAKWAYPSPRYYQIKISRAEHPLGGLYAKKHQDIVKTYSSQA